MTHKKAFSKVYNFRSRFLHGNIVPLSYSSYEDGLEFNSEAASFSRRSLLSTSIWLLCWSISLAWGSSTSRPSFRNFSLLWKTEFRVVQFRRAKVTLGGTS